MVTDNAPAPYQDALAQEFVRFAVESGVLRFGEFKTKAGRMSPYFFNAGLFDDGAKLGRLAQFYAQALLASGVGFDMVFGPAYKGIPLATAMACELAQRGRDLPLSFNRKEAKDHGEGGQLIGVGRTQGVPQRLAPSHRFAGRVGAQVERRPRRDRPAVVQLPHDRAQAVPAPRPPTFDAVADGARLLQNLLNHAVHAGIINLRCLRRYRQTGQRQSQNTGHYFLVHHILTCSLKIGLLIWQVEPWLFASGCPPQRPRVPVPIAPLNPLSSD